MVFQYSLEKLWSEKATRTSPLTAEVKLNVALKFKLLEVSAGMVNVANSTCPFINVSPSERTCAVSWAIVSSPSAVRRFVTGPPKRMPLPSPTGIRDTEEREVSEVFWTWPMANPPIELRSRIVGAVQTSEYVRLSADENLVLTFLFVSFR